MLPPLDTDARWAQIAQQQYFSVLRRGGLMNLVALPPFLLLWVILIVVLAKHALLLALFVVANLSLVFALGLFRRYRLIVDTPTSQLSSSAQGYVELHGKACLPDGEGFRGLADLPATVWLAGFVDNAPFVLDDGFGRCLLFPQNAEIVVQPGETHFAWLHAIYPGQTLYALGNLRSLYHLNTPAQRQERVANLLKEWKSQPDLLLKNFDENNNGKLDSEEWENVRKAAQQWADSDVKEQQSKPATHIIDTIQQGKLFLITNIPPEKLAFRYYFAATAHNCLWLFLLLWLCVK